MPNELTNKVPRKSLYRKGIETVPTELTVVPNDTACHHKAIVRWRGCSQSTDATRDCVSRFLRSEFIEGIEQEYAFTLLQLLLEEAIGDKDTILPEWIDRPKLWTACPNERTQDGQER